ncbi:MAG: hypothetical protein P5681_05240 [Limnospira sp. PMC 894.15]|nr:hypothetical protein [Limnospira sp. PMC 737.11]MDT9187205.1 hypothetical protein [Limnospira sp. PMC 894.15]MDT9233538.1 hypothetical protein [Limnospira sp. PMC 917.15]
MISIILVTATGWGTAAIALTASDKANQSLEPTSIGACQHPRLKHGGFLPPAFR